jgi:hypothetical protein
VSATAITGVARPAADRAAWASVRTLAAIEATGYARRVSLWAGWLATVLTAATQRNHWPAAGYEGVIPLSFSFMVLGVFVAGARTGSRDTDRDLAPLASEAALDGDDRAVARLLGLVMPVGLALLTAVGMSIVSRVEGGFWMGEGLRRTDSAAHTLLELLQPVLLVALAGAIGVVAGRATHRTVLVVIAGVFVWMALFVLYWVWNTPPLHVVSLVQGMPLRVPLEGVREMDSLPADWLVEYPTQYESNYVRELVHTPTIVLHDLYLIGLVMVVAAPVGRQHRRAVRLAGVGLAVIGVAGQLLVSPF